MARKHIRSHSRSRKGGQMLKELMPLAPRDLSFYNEEGPYTENTEAGNSGEDFGASPSGAVESQMQSMSGQSMSGGRKSRKHSRKHHKKSHKGGKKGGRRAHKTAKKHHKRK